MELPSKLIEQIAFNTRPQIEEHMLVVMDISTHEEHLSQPLQTNSKQFKIAVAFFTGYNGIFNVTISNSKFYFKKSITNEEDFIPITIPPGTYKLESMSNEIKRIIFDEGHYSKNEYPCTTKPNFSSLGSIIEKSPQGTIIGFVFNDSIRKLLRLDETILYKDYNISHNPVDILSFDNILLGRDFAKGMIFKGRRSGIIHNWTMRVDPGYKYVAPFVACITWYMTEIKDVISSICFKLKNKNNQLVTFNGQSISFRLSIVKFEVLTY